jgi:hypothetical protein
MEMSVEDEFLVLVGVADTGGQPGAAKLTSRSCQVSRRWILDGLMNTWIGTPSLSTFAPQLKLQSETEQ